jgi:hypothetical protein
MFSKNKLRKQEKRNIKTKLLPKIKLRSYDIFCHDFLSMKCNFKLTPLKTKRPIIFILLFSQVT